MPLFQSAMVAAKKYKFLLNSHLMTCLWHIKIFACLEILLLGYCDILMYLKISVSIYDPNFSYTWLDVPLQMRQSLSPLHFQKLLCEFYWRPWNPYIYFSVKFFGFWDVFDVSCIIILGDWFAKFPLVMVSLNDMFKDEFTDG